MRLGVLDIGSNTGHLLVVDAHDGAAPLPAFSHKQPLRLAEHLDEAGAVTQAGDRRADRLRRRGVWSSPRTRAARRCSPSPPRRSATRSTPTTCSAEVRDRTGVDIEVLSGEDEARLTFLAVRRWFGWSAGRLAVFDIGGGSLEIAGGADEAPRRGLVAAAGRGPAGARVLRRRAPGEDEVRGLRKRIRAEIARDAGNLLRAGRPTAPPPRPRRSARWPGSAARRRPATARWCRARCRSTS